MPVMGVTTFLGGTPQMSAEISGANEYLPGQNAVISITIQNQGLNTDKFVMQGTIERDDVPTTAKMVTVGLSPGNAPIVIKADPQNIGDVLSQGLVTVKIAAKITSGATAGEYQLPLTIHYTYLSSSDQPASDTLQSHYVQVNETFPITIKIKPQVQVQVLEAVPENLSVGTGGYISLKIKNIGSEDGKKATVTILRNGNSPIIPTDSSVYIGDFPQNGIVGGRYKVAVSGDAEEQTYPVDVVVSYENREGSQVISSPDTVGVPVQGKIRFTIISGPVNLTPGSDNEVAVQYRNSGTTTAYRAQARLTAVDPFTSTDNSAYLGDLKPGENATAHYRISTGGTAAIKDYALDTEVRYRDALDNSQVSDTFKVNFRVIFVPESNGPAPALPVILVAAVIVIAAGYYLLVMRKKN
jgi:hypothetical protein